MEGEALKKEWKLGHSRGSEINRIQCICLTRLESIDLMLGLEYHLLLHFSNVITVINNVPQEIPASSTA